jgi:hypothetical protein
MTSGMFAPDGTLVIVNRPCASVSAAAIGCPEIAESQRSQAAPVAMAASAVFGT